MATALLSSCTEEQPGPRTDSETHWLDSCLSPTQCTAPYTCHCGVCTIGCVESADCAAAGADAACYSVAESTCQGPAPTESGGYCFVDCGSDADCREWGSDLTCIDDMAGSATNWVWDYYDYYPLGSATNPQGPDTGPNRVVRGCMYYSTADVCRAAHRAPAATFGSGGVRLARSVSSSVPTR